MQLAHIYGENGVGFVIVDSEAKRSNWVVEPHKVRAAPVDDDALEAFFTDGLARVLPNWEPRPQQLEMARKTARALEDNRPLVIEAGTGTGKSLAYLVPAALWAKANKAKVAISTYTRALQTQLLTSDLPLLRAGGLEVSYAVLQGRNNYACRRRLALADQEDQGEPVDVRYDLDSMINWAKAAADGNRADLPFTVEPALWERVHSDSQLTLSVRCPHYSECFYYKARRTAAASDLIVVNHALWLADRVLTSQLGRGILPKVARVVLDEAHHLEDAATGAGSNRLTALAVRRAILPLLDARRRKGALHRMMVGPGSPKGPLSADARAALEKRVTIAHSTLEPLASTVQHLAQQIADNGLTQDGQAQRITNSFEQTAAWNDSVAPDVRHLAHELTRATEDLDAITKIFDDVKLDERHSQPMLDVRRAHARLTDHATIARAFLEPTEGRVRWIEPTGKRRKDMGAAVCAAPIDVGPMLHRILWEPLPGTISTSATLSVANRFIYWQKRHGLTEAETSLIPSPFDHSTQAVLGLPRDLPIPDHPDWMPTIEKTVIEAIEISDGGAFVLCTSYAMVRRLSQALSQANPHRPILTQGGYGRHRLLERFRDNERAVLVGTDSFWEGVSVRGRGLRLVVIPRLPFRVPTDPLRQARHEEARAKGRDPFMAYSLPEAVIKLRQGYGRLIRSSTDRGAVLLLDRRIHERRYGQVMLRSLPPARRVVGPWRRVAQALRDLYSEIGSGSD
jgi:ATP-dependent DNA helicase DinG